MAWGVVGARLCGLLRFKQPFSLETLILVALNWVRVFVWGAGSRFDKHGVWFLGGDWPADSGWAGMKTKLRTCAAPSGGVFQCWREGLGRPEATAAGLISSISRCGPWAWAVLGQNPRNLAREGSVIQQPEGLEGLGNMAAYLISMVFGWRQEFSCGFGAAWAGSGRRPSLSNVLSSWGWQGGGWYGAERRRQGGAPQGATATGAQPGPTAGG